MRTFYSFLIVTLFTSSFLTASENMRSDPNSDGSKRRAVTRSMATSAAPRSPLAPSASTNSNTYNFAEADNSRYRHNPSVQNLPEGQPHLSAALERVLLEDRIRQNTQDNGDWEETQLPTVHFLAKEIIVDYLLTDCKELSREERWQQIYSVHNLFLTCKHWIEFTLDRPISLGGKINPRWTPSWTPVTQFNGHQKRVTLIRTAMPRLLAELTGFDQSISTDKIGKITPVEKLYAHYTDAQIGRMLNNFHIQKKDGKRVYSLEGYHKEGRTLGPRYFRTVKRLSNSQEEVLTLSGLLKMLPHNIGSLTAVRELDLSDNALIELPSSIAQLSSLQTLNINNNPGLKNLPKSLMRMTSLKALGLSGTGAWENIELPSSVTTLIMENVNFSALTSFKADGLVLFEAKHEKADQGVEILTQRLSALSRLQKLVLKSTALPNLSGAFANCTSLKTLEFNRPQDPTCIPNMQNCPTPLGAILPASLKNLVIPGSLASQHMNSIASLSNLQVLNLLRDRGIPLTPQISLLKELRLLKLETHIFAPNMFNTLLNLEFLIFILPSQNIDLPSFGNSIQHLPHYTEFYSFLSLTNEIWRERVVLSRAPYPWSDAASRSLLSQTNLTTHNLFAHHRVRTNFRQGNSWLPSWIKDEVISNDLFMN